MRAPSILLISILASLLTAITSNAQPNERKNAIVSHIPRERVDSTAIAAVGYSKRLQALEIEFRNGAVYRYFDVPITLYRRLMAADSKAHFYDKNIRARYHSVHVKARKKK
jgi:hypothetical protein